MTEENILFRGIICCSGEIYALQEGYIYMPTRGLYALQEGYIDVREGCILFRGVICQGGIKYFTSWEPILSAKIFCPKQRESDATEDIGKSGNLGISSGDKKFSTVA